MNSASQPATLIICRDASDVERLRTVERSAEWQYVLASDDPSAHRAAERLGWIERTVWLERTASFYAVAPEVLSLLARINQWLSSLPVSRSTTPRLLHWSRVVEGGMTAQRLQDVLLLLGSYGDLLAEISPAMVIVVRTPAYHWEDDILAAICRSRRIPVVHLGSQIAIRARVAVEYIQWLCRGAYALPYVIARKCLGWADRHSGYQGDIIAFQLCSSEARHIENILPLMDSLKALGEEPVAVCWTTCERPRTRKASRLLRARGHHAEDLESWIRLKDILAGVLYTITVCWLARRHRKEFTEAAWLRSHDVALGPLMWPSIQFFVLAEVLHRFYLDAAARRYFAARRVKAFKVWGEGLLHEGALALPYVKGQGRPIVMFWLSTPLDSPYDHGADEDIDLYFAAGEWHRSYFQRRGIPDEKIELVSLPRFSGVAQLSATANRARSRELLGLPAHYDLYVLYDSGMNLRGYCSASERAQITRCILNVAATHPSVAILIKPHPHDRSGLIETLVGREGLSNVYLVAKSQLPFDALSAADLLVTRYSTLAAEAMLLKCPTVGMSLDGDKRFQVYGPAVEYLDSERDLERLVHLLCVDPGFAERWRANRLTQQRKLLDDLRVSADAAEAAEALLRRIRRRCGVEC